MPNYIFILGSSLPAKNMQGDGHKNKKHKQKNIYIFFFTNQQYKTAKRLIRFRQRPICKTYFHIIQFYLILPYNILQQHISAPAGNTPFSTDVRLCNTASFAPGSNNTKLSAHCAPASTTVTLSSATRL